LPEQELFSQGTPLRARRCLQEGEGTHCNPMREAVGVLLTWALRTSEHILACSTAPISLNSLPERHSRLPYWAEYPWVWCSRKEGVDGLDKNVALFIDYENVYWSMKNNYSLIPQAGRLIDLVKQQAQEEGQVVLSLAYADFDQPEFKGLQTELQRRSVEPRHVFSKSSPEGVRKNAADIELSLDALELIYTRDDIDTFVLVCGDRDLIQLIRKLHTRNKRVHVLGVARTTSNDLMMFADAFTQIEALMGISPAGTLNRDRQRRDMALLIQRLDTLEQGNLPFVGLKMLINRLLTGIGDPQSLVNQAIGEEIIITYSVPNPHKPQFPTTACKLNREHAQVVALLNRRSAKREEQLIRT
jgi:uncharacterized LabA/DUF88 family protein